MTKILIFGANGMLGSELVSFFSKKKNLKIYCTVRNKNSIKKLKFYKTCKIYDKIDATNKILVNNLIKKIKPNQVINCIGIVKQNLKNKSYQDLFKINSILPRYLSYLSEKYNFRLIHFSTDCVFSGKKGNYNENHFPDANDDYGISKYLGEELSPKNLIIRTSIIGHEYGSKKSLLEWFLKKKKIFGFKKAIFSGFTTYEIAKILYKYILKNNKISGILHISSKPISKYDLLSIIKKVYKKKIKIISDEKVIVDRSLSSDKFKNITKFKPKSWEKMIKEMYNSR